jgi:predicted nucleic acid-binding protein
MSSGLRIDFDLKHKLPSEIILDSSILYYVILTKPKKVEDQTLFNHAVTFLKRLESAYKAKNCIILVPSAAIAEVCRLITKDSADDYRKTNKPLDKDGKLITGWKQILKNDKSLIKRLKIIDKIQDFINILDALGIVIIQPKDLSSSINVSNNTLEERTIRYMYKLELQFDDANILAIADRLGVKNIASLDSDFTSIVKEGFTIYTSSIIK